MNTSSLGRELERQRQSIGGSTIMDVPDEIMSRVAERSLSKADGIMSPSPAQSGVAKTGDVSMQLSLQLDLSPGGWDDQPDALLDRSATSAAGRAERGGSPRRSPRASPQRTASPPFSEGRLNHEQSDHAGRAPADGDLKSPERNGALGSNRPPDKDHATELFHKRFGNDMMAFVDGEKASLVEDWDRQRREADLRSPATRGYQLVGQETHAQVPSTRPSPSLIHRKSRVTTGASFLDADMPYRPTFLVLRDERKLALAAMRDRDTRGHLPVGKSTRATANATLLPGAPRAVTICALSVRVAGNCAAPTTNVLPSHKTDQTAAAASTSDLCPQANWMMNMYRGCTTMTGPR